MTVIYRALPAWPHESAPSRSKALFTVGLEDTKARLEYEVHRLQRYGHPEPEILVGVGWREGDVRLDGQPRAGVREPLHPGVEVSFDSVHGRLTYATDMYYGWKDNLRAIALGLEALRAVARYGVAKRGQQYAGFALLAAGPGLEARGKEIVEETGSITKALRATHPDTRDARYVDSDYQAVIAFRRAEEAAGR